MSEEALAEPVLSNGNAKVQTCSVDDPAGSSNYPHGNSQQERDAEKTKPADSDSQTEEPAAAADADQVEVELNEDDNPDDRPRHIPHRQPHDSLENGDARSDERSQTPSDREDSSGKVDLEMEAQQIHDKQDVNKDEEESEPASAEQEPGPTGQPPPAGPPSPAPPSAEPPSPSADPPSPSADPPSPSADPPSPSADPPSPSAEAAAPAANRFRELVSNKALTDAEKFLWVKEAVQSGEYRSKDVVETVLELLVEAEFDLESAFIVQDPANVVRLVELLDVCAESLQAEIWSLFCATLRKSSRNLQACVDVGLIRRLLDRVEPANDVVATFLVQIMGELSSYNITVEELRALFKMLRLNNGKWRRHSVKVLTVLKHMPLRFGPTEFFSFPGTKGAAISLNPMTSWPGQAGWTWSTWFRLDPRSGANIEQERPYLYCFRTSKGLGYSANFLGSALVITSMKVAGKGLQHCVNFDFQPRQWYHLAVVHVYNRWSKSEIRCFVDGQLISTCEMSWYISTADPYDRCFIGGSTEMDYDHMFCGQMACIYLFSEPLQAGQVSAMHVLGPAYSGTFKWETEANLALTERHMRTLYDGKMHQSIVFMYSAAVCDQNLCLECSSKPNSGTQIGASSGSCVAAAPAFMRDGVKAIRSQSIHSSLNSIGGLQILYPLFGQVDSVQEETGQIDTNVPVLLLDLIGDLIKDCPMIQRQAISTRCFYVIARQMEKASVGHRTEKFLQALLRIVRQLSHEETTAAESAEKRPLPLNQHNRDTLLRQVCDSFVFNPAFWVHAPDAVQLRLYHYMATDFIQDSKLAHSNTRRVSLVFQTLHALKFYYWVINPRARSGIAARGEDEARPSLESLVKIRTLLLLFVKQLVLRGQGVFDEELQAMLSYLVTVHEDDNIKDILQMTVTLMSEQPASMVPAFSKCHGVRTVFKVMASPNANIRLLAVKLLSFFLSRSTAQRKQEVMVPQNLFQLLSERLLVHDTVDMATYNVLYEMMVERVPNELVRRRVAAHKSHTLENPLLLRVIAHYLVSSYDQAETDGARQTAMQVRVVFLEDLLFVCNVNRMNRRVVLQQSVWQDWLLSLAFIYPETDLESRCTELVMQLFKVLLHHALKLEWGGWRVWIDTLSVLHYHVSLADWHRITAARQEQASKEPASQESASQEPASQDSASQEPAASGTVGVDNGVPSEERTDDEKAETTTKSVAETTTTNSVPSVGDAWVGPFETPPFHWSALHKRLLRDVLDSLEADLDVWKAHASKTIVELVNANDNHVFVVNVTHFISQLSDMLVTACGGLLPLLSLVTTLSSQLEIVEPNYGLDLESAVFLLHRLAGIVDIVIFASSINFSELEQEKNMSQGAILRQCLRIVCMCAVRNCIECRYKDGSLDDQMVGTPQPTVSATSAPATGTETSASAESGGDGAEVGHDGSVSHGSVGSGSVGATSAATAGATPSLVGAIEGSSPRPDFISTLVHGIQRGYRRRRRELRRERQRQTPRQPTPTSSSVTDEDQESTADAESPGAQANIEEAEETVGSADEDVGDGDDGDATEADGSASSTANGDDSYTLSIEDPLKLIQDVDVNRLKAVIYRDVEDTKQAQYLALAVVYFVSVLMVCKYRDVLESAGANSDSTGANSDSAGANSDSAGPSSQQTSEASVVGGPATAGVVTDEVSLEQIGLDEDRSAIMAEEGGQEEAGQTTGPRFLPSGDDNDDNDDNGDGYGDDGKGSGTVDSVGQDGGGAAETRDGDEMGTSASEEQSSSLRRKASVKVSAIHVEDDSDEAGHSGSALAADSSSTSAPVYGQSAIIRPSRLPRGSVSQRSSTDVSQQLVTALSSVAPLLHEVFQDFAPYLAKTLVGSHGQDIFTSGLNKLRQLPLHQSASSTSGADGSDDGAAQSAPKLTEAQKNGQLELFTGWRLFQEMSSEKLKQQQAVAVVELVMLLCSQQWQQSLQKYAGLAFIELVNEGRVVSNATREHMVRVAKEAVFILNRMRNEDLAKHAEFEALSARTAQEQRLDEDLCDRLIQSARHRDRTHSERTVAKVQSQLLNKNGLWAEPAVETKPQFWRLDPWEDDSRRRRRFVPNPNGSSHPEASLKAALEHGASDHEIMEARNAVTAKMLETIRQRQPRRDKTVVFSDEELLSDREMLEALQDGVPDAVLNQADLQSKGPVKFSAPCRLLSMGVAVAGTLSVTHNEIYFDMDDEAPANKAIEPQVLAYMENLHGRWHFNEVRAIFSRRYLLQPVALEIFLSSRTSIMVAFNEHGTMRKAIGALPKVGVGVKYGLPAQRKASLASPQQLFKLSGMTQRWQRREVSNFDYLMFLNTIAGRSYNDLNQYPVFPWVLANYESSELDLNEPNNFRDLSKPVGALNAARRKIFEERYQSWEHDTIPPFHYGTHYSTSAFVLNYLFRIEPFTSLFIAMQGGKFDHANRLFSSLALAWANCQRDTADVKELIPELFFMPEMLVNMNGYQLGKQEDGSAVGDVQLPPWAQTPQDFVRIHRQALESELVSCQLHQWIDLIFGYKQRGPEAVRSCNVFYYLTYEGNVELDSIPDPVLREALENQIRSFGQTPSQLLTEPHPARNSPLNVSPSVYQPHSDQFLEILKFLSSSAACHVAAHTYPSAAVPGLSRHLPMVVSVTANYNFALNKWSDVQPTSPVSSDVKLQFPSMGAGREASGDGPAVQRALPLAMDRLYLTHQGLHKRSIGGGMDIRLKPTHWFFCVTPDNRCIVAVGFWDRSFRVVLTETGQVVQTVYAHGDVVTCVARSEANMNGDCLVATGSRDCTAMLWHFSNSFCAISDDTGSSTAGHDPHTVSRPAPKCVLTGHFRPVTCLLISSELGLVVSGSEGGLCLIHTTAGDQLRSISPYISAELAGQLGGLMVRPLDLALTRDGLLIVSYDKAELRVCIYTLSGTHLSVSQLAAHVTTMACTKDGQFVVCGDEDGLVTIWRVCEMSRPIFCYQRAEAPIRHLRIAHDQRHIVCGMGNGAVGVLCVNFNLWSQPQLVTSSSAATVSAAVPAKAGLSKSDGASSAASGAQ